MDDHQLYTSTNDRDIIIEEDDGDSTLPESPAHKQPSYSPSVALISSPSNQHHQHNQQHFKETMPTHQSSNKHQGNQSGRSNVYIEEEFEDSDEESDLSAKHENSTSTLISQTSSSTVTSRTPLTTADSSKSRFGLKIDIPSNHHDTDFPLQHQDITMHHLNAHLYDEDDDFIEELEKISTPKRGEDRARGVHFDQTATNKEEEELFVKTLSARKHTLNHTEKKPLPTTPKGEKSLEELTTLSPIGKAKFLHQDTSPKTKHFVTGSKMFHVTTEQSNLKSQKNPTLSYKNMSGVKLSKLEQIYQNYSKPMQLTPHTIEEAHITEKRLKKIRSTVPFHSNEIIKAEVLLKEDYTHSPNSPTYQSTWSAFKEANSLSSPPSLNNTMSSVNTYQDMSYSSPKSNGSQNLSPSSHKSTAGTALDSPSHYSTTSTMRASSPTNTSPSKNGSWSKFTGGFYNSPRCFNTNHKHLNDPNFLRKNANEEIPAKRIMIESEKDNPILQKKKEEIKTMHAKVNIRSCSPTNRSRNNSLDGGSFRSVNSSFDKASVMDGHTQFLNNTQQIDSDHLSIRAHSVISPMPPDRNPKKEKLTADDIHKKRNQTYNDPNTMHAHSSFITQFRPKQMKKRNPDETEEEANQRRIYENATKKEIKVEHLSTKKANFFNFKDFDRSTMALVNNTDPALAKLFDPKNYPAEMQAQVEYFKRRRNMNKNDYQNFSPNRSQKQHTPYLYYRRNAIKQYMEFKHKLECELGEEISDLPHNLFKGDQSTLNVSLPSIKQKVDDNRINTSSIN